MTTMTTTAYQTGPRAGQQIAAQRLQVEREQLAEDLARWAGDAAERAHDEDIATSTSYGVPARHYTRCCEQARDDAERNMYEFAMKLPLEHLRRRHTSELAEHAVQRARREGVLSPTT